MHPDPASASASAAVGPVSRLPRLASWWLLAVLLSLAVFFIAPQQIPLSLYKLNLIALAAVAGYWIDRKVFPYARPSADIARQLALYAAWNFGQLRIDKSDAPSSYVIVQGFGRVDVHTVPQTPPAASVTYFLLGCMLRRAIIMAAAVLAVSLGA